MIDKTNNTNDNCPCYRSPEVNVIEVNVQSVLCQSNESMGENDISGSFSQN